MSEKRSWLTPKEVASIPEFGITERAVRWQCEQGKIPGAVQLTPRGDWRIPKTYVIVARRLFGRPLDEAADFSGFSD